MPIAILFDKSSFQGLNFNDIIELHRYFIVNVTPLIVSEILGDLSKEEKEGRPSPKDYVISLSNKIFPNNTYVNIHYQELLINSLLGQHTNTSNRPLLKADKTIVSNKGNGLVFKETTEELLLKKWKKGDFNHIDEIISHSWRNNSQKENIIDDFKKHFEYLSKIKIENTKLENYEKMMSLKASLESEILDPGNSKVILGKIIEYFEIPQEIAAKIFYRLETSENKNLKDFAPYALYCYSIPALYYTGINNDLFGERKTNLLDLEYLYYLPFTKVFSSNDKFLIRMFEAINLSEVHFISLAELKEDLKKFQLLNDNDNWSEIPPDENSKIYAIWDKEFDLDLSKKIKSSENDKKDALKRFKEIIDLHEKGQNSGNFEGESDFVIKESYMSINDPCVCKSGKKLKDCCYKQ